MVVGVFVNSHFDIVGEFSDRLSPKNANDLGRGEFSLRPKTDSLFDEEDEDSQVMSMLDWELEKQRDLASSIEINMRGANEAPDKPQDQAKANQNDDLKIQLIKKTE